MSNQGHNAPSFGTKVDLGDDAPVRREGAGIVPDDSLAAESYNRGGEFASNRDAKPDSNYSNVNEVYGDTGRPSFPQGETAPTYVLNQYNQEATGPHGKNIAEDNNLANIDTRDGLKRALNSEPGSMDDPSRLAEEKFKLQQNSVGRDGGPKEPAEGTVNPFDTLNRKDST